MHDPEQSEIPQPIHVEELARLNKRRRLWTRGMQIAALASATLFIAGGEDIAHVVPARDALVQEMTQFPDQASANDEQKIATYNQDIGGDGALAIVGIALGAAVDYRRRLRQTL